MKSSIAVSIPRGGTGPKRTMHKHSLIRFQSGQALIEVVLIVPVLAALFFGSIELGRFAYIGILVGNAARAGAAYGSQSILKSIDTTGIQGAADNDFQNNGQSASNISVSSSVSCGCDDDGTFTAATSCTTGGSSTAGVCTAGQWVDMVTVTVTGTFHPMFHYPWIRNSVTFTKSATMRVNQVG